MYDTSEDFIGPQPKHDTIAHLLSQLSQVLDIIAEGACSSEPKVQKSSAD
jgi:hypothetical protein